MLSLPSALSIYVTLVFPRKSAVGIPAIMSCIVDVFVLSLDPDHSEAVLWTLNAFFFPVRNLHSLSYLCPIFLCSVPKTFQRPPRSPLQHAIRLLLLPVPHPDRRSFARPRVLTLPAISVYARMSECSVPRRVQMVFGNHAPKKHTTRRHRAPARPPP